MYYVESGGVDVTVDGETVPLEAGEALRVDAAESRQIVNRDASHVSCWSGRRADRRPGSTGNPPPEAYFIWITARTVTTFINTER